MREIKFSEAIAEGLVAAMEENHRVFVMGEGVDDPKAAFGTTAEALRRFGSRRVFDTPLSESALSGVAVGAAIEGHPCVYVHMRSEFALLGIDQLLNHAAKWRYMSAGAMQVPLVIRCLIGRGWGQAAQHSQSLHALFAQVPGIKVVLPASPSDAKGLLCAAIRDPNPVVFLEHRWLYDKTGAVSAEAYEVPLGQARVAVSGKDITCVTLSYGVYECLEAREILAKVGIEVEVVDLRTIRPLDRQTILASVQKTGLLCVHDPAPALCGVSAEIAAVVAETHPEWLRGPVIRSTFPDCPTPCSSVLEDAYYPSAQLLAERMLAAVRSRDRSGTTLVAGTVRPESSVPVFQGPF